MQNILEICTFTGGENRNHRGVLECGKENLSKLNSIMWKRNNRKRRENEDTMDLENENSRI